VNLPRSVSAALLGSLLSASCERHETGEPTLTPASRTDEPKRATGVERATEEIAGARCKRELGCDNIGPDEAYTSHEDCMRSLWIDTYDELSACEDGVDRRELDECLTEIAAHGCGDVLAHLDSYAACRLAELCTD
jgi:hypothetical protein